MAERPHKLLRATHIYHNHVLAAFDSLFELRGMDQLWECGSQAAQKTGKERNQRKECQAGKSVVQRRAVAGGRLAARMSEPRVGRGTGRHADQGGAAARGDAAA